MKLPTKELTRTVIDYEKAGQRVRDARMASRLSLRKAAKMIGISAMYLSHLERGMRAWNADLFDDCMATIKLR